MTQCITRLPLAILATMGFTLVLLLTGCTGISVQPSCPTELDVSESGAVSANEQNPGAIARYQWEAIPSNMGAFDDPTAPTTIFRPDATGDVELKLTASDGIYQVISSCVTKIIGPPNVSVSLSASPQTAGIDEVVTLTCLSTGDVAATILSVTQVSGPAIRISDISPGVVTIRPLVEGTTRFQCIGESGAGESSNPVEVTITVSAEPDPVPPPPGGGRR